jgi:voltage-gated potassium channel Kch
MSMIAGPLLQTLYDAKLHRLLVREKERPFDRIEAREMRVLIAGFGRFGQIIGRVLRARRIPFTAVDVSTANIDFIRRFGSDVYYGDASRLDLLRAAGTDKAAALVVAVDDVEASLRIVELVQQHFPAVKIFARARNRQHAFRLMAMGVKTIIRETYASSLEMASAVLQGLGASEAEARVLIERFRKHDEATMRRQAAVRDDDVKLIAAAREAALQLEHLFESDTAPEDLQSADQER